GRDEKLGEHATSGVTDDVRRAPLPEAQNGSSQILAIFMDGFVPGLAHWTFPPIAWQPYISAPADYAYGGVILNVPAAFSGRFVVVDDLLLASKMKSPDTIPCRIISRPGNEPLRQILNDQRPAMRGRTLSFQVKRWTKTIAM